MKVIDRIDDDFIEVRLLDNQIQCYNLKSRQVVAQEHYTKPIEKIEKKNNSTYLMLNKKNEYISTIAIFTSFVDEVCRFSTSAGYILGLQMLTATHGFYFGYYEIGEFFLKKSNKLLKRKVFPVNVCIIGCGTVLKQLYLSVRKNDKYFIIKLDWKRKHVPVLIWEKEVPSTIMVMEITENRLFTGMKDGTIQIWDTDKDEFIEENKILSSEISLIKVYENYIIVGDKTGEVASISYNASIKWKIKLSEHSIVGMHQRENDLIIIDADGKIYAIDSTSGNLIGNPEEIVSKGKNVKFVSDLVTYRGYFVVSVYGGIWYISSINLLSSFQHYMNDPLVRVLKQHPFGFYSGDDEGYIRFWTLGSVSIKMEHYDPPLKEVPNLDEVYRRLLGLKPIE